MAHKPGGFSNRQAVRLVMGAAVAGLCGLLMPHNARGGVVGFDNAASLTYNSGWTNGSNGGYGFGPWLQGPSGSGVNQAATWGSATYSSANIFGTTASPNIDTNGVSWQLWAYNGTGSDPAAPFAYRPLPGGNTLSIDITTGLISNPGAEGLELQSYNPATGYATPVLEFAATGSGNYYAVSYGGYNSYTRGFANSRNTQIKSVHDGSADQNNGNGLNVSLTLTSLTTGNLTVTPLNTAIAPETFANLSLTNPPNELFLFNNNLGLSSQDAYFNNMQISAPAALTIANNATLNSSLGLIGNPVAFSNNTTGGLLQFTGGGNSTLLGAISITGTNTTNTIDGGAPANVITLSGSITSGSNNTLVLQDGTFGFWLMGINNSTFSSGTLQVGDGAIAGTLAFATEANLPAAGVGITLDAGTLENNSGGALTIANNITLQTGGGTLNTNSLGATFTGAISGSGGLTVSGGGAAILAAANTFTGATVVNNAVLTLAAGGTIANTSAFTISAGASVNLLNQAAGNGITINYGANPSPNATVRSELLAGYASGAWNGTSATSGVIISTTAQAAGLTVGYSDNGAGVEKIMVTLPGDANLDGTVNGSDFLILRNNFGMTSGAQWNQGDFTYSGAVNGTDFLLLRNNFGKTLTSAAATSTPTPEPATLLLLGVGLILCFPALFRRPGAAKYAWKFPPTGAAPATKR